MPRRALSKLRRCLSAASVALLGACGSGQVDAFGEVDELDGVWSLDGDDLLVLDLDLHDAILSAQGPCHRLLGSFTVTEDGLATFTVPGTATSSCDADDLSVELGMVEDLEAVERWEIDGASLVLSGPDVALRFSSS